MKDIVVFKKTEELHRYDLWITFDKQEELDLWLETTLENKDNLMVMQTFKRRNIKYYKCEECEQISSADDINNATIKYFGEGIEPITGVKYDGDYMCPKCNTLICGECFEEID
jgi:hypothetical protein